MNQATETGTCVGVCGFPRSGSSMLMRMLHAAGIEPIVGSSDRGYELAGGLGRFASTNARTLAGHSVKLLDYGQWFGHNGLPCGVSWQFIWSDRDPVEQARSTVKLMAPFGVETTRDAVRKLAKSYRRDRAEMLAWYRQRGQVLVTSFEAILADPLAESRRIGEFLPWITWEAAAPVVHDRSPKCAPDLAFETGVSS